jgi:hypothetical protein
VLHCVTHRHTYKQQHTEQEEVTHPTHQRIKQHIKKTGKLRSIDLDKKVHHASGYQNNKKPRKSHEQKTQRDDHKKWGYNKNKNKRKIIA